ncbi:LysR family transcriptional regulator [Bradyrhizobium sp. 14AA]
MSVPRLSRTDLNLRPLYYFLKVVELGSFSKAAAALATSQSVLSREIRQLEEQYGLPLLHRNGRGVTPTSQGSLLFSASANALEHIVRARDSLAATRNTLEGEIILAVPPLFGEALLFGLIQSLGASEPGIKLTFVEGHSMDISEWLANGKVNLAVVYNPPRISTLLAHHFWDERIHLVGPSDDAFAPSGSEVSLPKIATLPFIIAPRPNRLRTLIDDAMNGLGAGLKICAEIDGPSTILELVSHGKGYTIFPESMLHSALARTRLSAWPIKDPRLKSRLCLVNSMNRPLTSVAKRVIEEVKARLKRKRGVGTSLQSSKTELTKPRAASKPVGNAKSRPRKIV